MYVSGPQLFFNFKSWHKNFMVCSFTVFYYLVENLEHSSPLVLQSVAYWCTEHSFSLQQWDPGGPLTELDPGCCLVWAGPSELTKLELGLSAAHLAGFSKDGLKNIKSYTLTITKHNASGLHAWSKVSIYQHCQIFVSNVTLISTNIN